MGNTTRGRRAGDTPRGPRPADGWLFGPGDPDVQVIEGVLDRIVYEGGDDGWTVAVMRAQPGGRPVKLVGSMLGLQPGEHLRVRGKWERDPRYGEQFSVHGYITITPSTEDGIERYLASRLVDGIGKVMARRLVDHFGVQTLEVIEAHPERLTEVPGIGKVRAKRIREAWERQKGIKEVMLFLQTHRITPSIAVRIFQKYGKQAVAKVKSDPFSLASEVKGIGFLTADRIANSLGIPPDAPERIRAGVLFTLQGMADDGHVFAPVTELRARAVELLRCQEPLVDDAISWLRSHGRVVVEPMDDRAEDAVYLARLHGWETGLAGQIARLLGAPASTGRIKVDAALAWMRTTHGLALAPMQAEAVAQALTEKVMVLTGGPGTGKTTILKAVVRIAAAKRWKIRLAAPTGRAAKRLSEATGMPASTLHRLLEYSPKHKSFERNQGHPLAADLVVVDETSMMDLELAHALVSALPDRCRLVLVGDVDQLPSVGPGDVLGELIRSGALPVVRLTEVFRQAATSMIVANAHRINRGQMPERGEGLSDFFVVEREEPEEVLAALRELVVNRIPKRFGFDPVSQIQILTPMRRGSLGADELNRTFQALLNPSGPALLRGAHLFRAGDKVMQVRNNYDLEVFNGDVGVVIRVDPAGESLEVRYDDRVVGYERLDLDQLVLAYATTVHKSQGSEYPAVVIPLHTQHYLMLRRNLLYTAVTRGRELVVVVGSRRALEMAVHNRQGFTRWTMLASRLRGLV